MFKVLIKQSIVLKWNELYTDLNGFSLNQTQSRSIVRSIVNSSIEITFRQIYVIVIVVERMKAIRDARSQYNIDGFYQFSESIYLKWCNDEFQLK